MSVHAAVRGSAVPATVAAAETSVSRKPAVRATGESTVESAGCVTGAAAVIAATARTTAESAAAMSPPPPRNPP